MKLFLSVLLFCIATTSSPGPNNIMIMASGLNYGVRRSLPHYFGICLGFPAMVLIVGLFLGAVFMRFPLFQQIIKTLGIIYLLYLAWKIITADTEIGSVNKNKSFSFVQAFFFQWVNPKAWVMVVGAVSAFSTNTSNMTHQAIVIALAFLIACFPCIGLWLGIGIGLKKGIKNSFYKRQFNYVMGGLLILSVLMILFD